MSESSPFEMAMTVHVPGRGDVVRRVLVDRVEKTTDGYTFHGQEIKVGTGSEPCAYWFGQGACSAEPQCDFVPRCATRNGRVPGGGA